MSSATEHPAATAVALNNRELSRTVPAAAAEPGPPAGGVQVQAMQAMQQAGIDPAFIYAYEKTGGLSVTEENQHLISAQDLAG